MHHLPDASSRRPPTSTPRAHSSEQLLCSNSTYAMKTTPYARRAHFPQERRHLHLSQTLNDSRKLKRKREPGISQEHHAPNDEEPKRQRKSRSRDELRKWAYSARDLSTLEDRFVLVSYNILGDDNAFKHRDLYTGVQPEDLDWERRKRRICKELRRYKPSILCLQEVDKFDDLASLLHKDGFNGLHKGRTGEAIDGCAIFWKENQFTLLHQEDIEYQEFGLRNNVAQLCVLKMHHDHSMDAKGIHEAELNRSSRTVIVCNIHVLFNPNRGDIKLGQLRMLLERAYALSQEWVNSSIVIAGDFNSMPQSALYQFVSSSELNIALHDRRKISLRIDYPFRNDLPSYHFENGRRYPISQSSLRYSWSNEEIFLAVGSRSNTHLQHQLSLSSAYPGVPGSCDTRDTNGEPLATSYHSRFMGTVDYIWHSHDLVPVKVLETLPTSVLRKTGGLPSQNWGSDHFALVCEFAFANSVKGDILVRS